MTKLIVAFRNFATAPLRAFKIHAIQNKKLTFTRAAGSRVWEFGFELYSNSAPQCLRTAVTVAATSVAFCIRSEVGNRKSYTYQMLPTPWSRVLLEKLTGSQLVKKFLAFCGTHRFNTVFTRACPLSLS